MHGPHVCITCSIVHNNFILNLGIDIGSRQFSLPLRPCPRSSSLHVPSSPTLRHTYVMLCFEMMINRLSDKRCTKKLETSAAAAQI